MTESKIEWTDRSDWNPIRGCTRVSPGCGGPGPHGGCYAEAMAARFSKPGMWGHGIAEMNDGKPRWTGKVELQEDRITLPLKWRKPAKIFVSSTSDVFHEALPDEAIDKIFAVMALCPQHTFQVLTKRAERMREYLTASHTAPNVNAWQARVCGAIDEIVPERTPASFDAKVTTTALRGSLPNVWLGISCERQQEADERIPLLLQTPAAVRFISAEPLLGAIDLHDWLTRDWHPTMPPETTSRLDWVISGGESGPNARPAHVDWYRGLRDQCVAAGVAYFHKQNGEWLCGTQYTAEHRDRDPDAEQSRFDCMDWDGEKFTPSGGAWCDDLDEHAVYRVGKKSAGRLLDGRTYDGMPVR